MFKIKVAETESEADSAYELFYRNFGTTYYDSKKFFDSTRKYDPTMTNENLFIIKERKSVVVAARTVRRSIKIFDKTFDIGGIATTVVHPNYRGKGFFDIITQFVIDEMIKKRGLSFCMVFARRAIDNIYVKHGFWGTPVERRFIVLDPPNLDKKLSFRKMQIEDIPFLEKTYKQVYGKMPVFLDRPKALWANKLKNPSLNERLNGYIFTNNEKKIGYTITENGKGIIETCSHNENPDAYKFMLFSKNSPAREAALTGMALSTEHPAIKAFRGHAYSIFTRHPHYGGNILKILNPYNRESKIMKLVESKLAECDVKIPDDFRGIPSHIVSRVLTAALFGYEVPETREVLKISEDSKWNILKPIDFIFSTMDDF